MVLYDLQSTLLCIIIAALRDSGLSVFYSFLLKVAHLVHILATSLLMRSWDGCLKWFVICWTHLSQNFYPHVNVINLATGSGLITYEVPKDQRKSMTWLKLSRNFTTCLDFHLSFLSQAPSPDSEPLCTPDEPQYPHSHWHPCSLIPESSHHWLLATPSSAVPGMKKTMSLFSIA